MNPISATELARMRSYQAETLLDECVLLQAQTSSNGYGYGPASYTDGSTERCGFNPGVAKEDMVSAQVADIDAQLRLRVDVPVTNLDRVRLTKRFGESLTTPEVYAVVGNPKRGPSGLVLNLRAVTDRSSV